MATATRFNIISDAYTHGTDLERRTGVLAHGTKWGRVLRLESVGEYGNMVFTYFQVPDVPGRPLEPLGGGVDDVGEFVRRKDEVVQSAQSSWCELIDDVPPFEAEVLTFERQFPLIAQHLGLPRPKPIRMFESGPVYYLPRRDPATDVPREMFQHHKDRHLAGDFGSHGALAAAGPLSEDCVFCEGIEAVSFRNALAIERGFGLVRSVYPVGALGDILHVITRLAGPDTMTCCVVTRGIESVDWFASPRDRTGPRDARSIRARTTQSNNFGAPAGEPPRAADRDRSSVATLD